MNLDIFVQRQLENLRSGNGAYLEVFLAMAREAGASIRLVFAPSRSFGNRPWAHFHPRFEALSDSVVWPYTVRVGRTYISLSGRVWWRFAVRLVKAARQRLGMSTRIYSYLGTPLDDDEADVVAHICNRGNAQLCVAEYSSLAPVLKKLSDDKLKGVLMHDLFSDRAARFRANGLEPDFLEITSQTEAAWCADADVAFYASANEMASFNPRLPRAHGLWLRPKPPQHTIKPSSGPVRVVFLGTLHAGNGDALCHFIDDIWPRIHRAHPDIEFLIAGAIGNDPEVERRRAPGIRVLGRVDDLADIGGADAIGVAPTRLATGVSIKVAEYLMLGMPTVVYDLALEGFGDTLSDLVDSAGDPDTFADRVIALINDPDKRAQRSRDSARQAGRRLTNDDVVDYLRSIGSNVDLTLARASSN